MRGLRATDWSHLVEVLAERRRGIIAAVVLGVVWTGGKIAVPSLTRVAIDRAIDQGSSAIGWALWIVVAGVATGVLTAGRRYLAFRESRTVEARLRRRIHDHVLGLHMAFHDRSQTGQLMSRMSADLNQVQMFVVMVPLTVSHVALIAGVTVVLIITDPLLALVALAPLPLITMVAKRFSDAIHPAVLAVQAEQAQLSSVVEESISGVRVVKGFGAEQVRLDAVAVEADDIQRVSLEAALVRARFLPLMELLPALGLIGVLGIGGLRVLDGSMTVGELVAYNFYVALLVWPLRSISMTLAFGQRASAALERIDEVLSVAPAIVAPDEPRSLPNSRGGLAVHFDHVQFGYDDTTVLDGLDLEIPTGSSVAIVGATASGKSTVARLLLRFYDPVAGAVRLGGHDLRDLDPDDVRRAVQMVFEDTLLFHDTVAANIAFAAPGATLDAVRTAARAAGADFIDDLPDGIDTVLGERGYSLSGGQRQRIAIARVLLANPAVLILDDATSAVDPAKEHEIRSAMATAMHGRTTIVIAHRPGTIAMADRVVLLEGGRIVASGRHNDLLATEPRYRTVLAESGADL